MLTSEQIRKKYKDYFKAVNAYTSMPRYRELVTKKNDKDFDYADFKDVFESEEYKKLLEELKK